MVCLASLLVNHPFKVLLGIALFSSMCIILPFTLKALPDFSDPRMGFQTRGTSISDRMTSWINLLDETKEHGRFTANPKQFLQRNNITNLYKHRQKKGCKRMHRKISSTSVPTTKDTLYAQLVYAPSNVTDTRRKTWRELKKLLTMSNFDKKILGKPGTRTRDFFCGPPNQSYAHIVLSHTTGKNLFNLASLMSLCYIEQELIQTKYYTELCVEAGNQPMCCKPWSLPNYIAALKNRSSCLAITEEDVDDTLRVLKTCSQYYHSLQLTEECDKNRSCEVPRICSVHGAVYNILNYLTSTSFMPENRTDDVVLRETIIFMPLASSTAMLPYYHELEKMKLDHDGIAVVAMELGVKSALFDEYLIRDTWLISAGGLFVLLAMWIYTLSLFLTIMAIIAIAFSLGISYFMYTTAFGLKFFPFMNLLAIIVAVGIGADNAFIFCKVWQNIKYDDSIPLLQIMKDTMGHALISMIVTSFTTAAAFFASFVSAITAIKCFSVFASVSVLANCFLMVFWFPACVIIMEKFPFSPLCCLRGCFLTCIEKWCSIPQWRISRILHEKYLFLERMLNELAKKFIDCIIKFKYLWFILLTLLAIISAGIVLYYPKLKLPNTPEFQLLTTSHMFEQYDLKYKHMFWFNRYDRLKNETTERIKLPLRFVWGVIPQDNGNYLEPQSLGTLEIDESFNISTPEAQKWLLKFCKNLKRQPFYYHEDGILLQSCFIETFIRWMERPCEDGFEDTDRSPCCEASNFPFESYIFNMCIVEAIGELYDTIYHIPGAAGPKFSKDEAIIKAIVIEYESNYSYSLSYDYMNNFINTVESWFDKQLETAPKAMKGGWFSSTFDFYDLQKVLSEGTIAAIGVSLCLALIVMYLSTSNVLDSAYAIINICCSIFVTIAALVLLGWQLNILESIAVCTAIGLTVDFPLHYIVNYRFAPSEIIGDRQEAARHALTNMLKPVSMAALTTGMAGVFMLPSAILPYIQIGRFLATVMAVSWVYATCHLGALLAIAGPQNNFGQFNLSQICKPFKCDKTATLSRKRSDRSLSDTHELDVLTYSSAPNLLTRTLSETNQPHSSRYYPNDHSPSLSAISVIMTEDTDV